MRENYFLDDGAYAAVKIVIEAVKRRLEGSPGLRALLEQLHEPAESKEYRLKIKVRVQRGVNGHLSGRCWSSCT